MELKKIWELYTSNKEPVNCVYKRSGGRLGHCYIDPTKPLRAGNAGRNYGYMVTSLDDLIRYNNNGDVTVTVFKQLNDVEIYVKPENLWIHKRNTEQVVKVLYGTTKL